jgi:hypothetical protein
MRLEPLPLLMLPPLFPSLFDASASPFELVGHVEVKWSPGGASGRSGGLGHAYVAVRRHRRHSNR